MWPRDDRASRIDIELIKVILFDLLIWSVIIGLIIFFVTFFAAESFGQSATIPNLTLDSSPTSTDQLIVHKSGETRAKKTTRGTLRANLSGVGSCSAGQYVSTLNSDAAPTCTADDDTPDSDAEVPNAITLNGGTLSGTNTMTGTLSVSGGLIDLDGGTEGTLRVRSATTLPATCTIGDIAYDTDADTDGSLYVCRATNTWKEIDDDGGAGGSGNSFETIDAPNGTDPVADSATDTLDLDAGWGIELTGTAASDKLDIARRNPTSYIEIVEEFAGGTTTAGNVGENGLHGYGTTPSRLAAEAGRPGLYRMSTPATDGAVRGIGFAAANNSSIIDIDDVERAIFIVRPVLNTLVEVRCGFGQDLNNTAYGSDGVYFEFDTGVGLNWTTITRASSTSTTNTTAIAVAANTWYRLEIVRNSSTNYEFYIDGALVFTHSANKPTIVLNMGCAVEANSAAIRELDYDLYVLTAAVSR